MIRRALASTLCLLSSAVVAASAGAAGAPVESASAGGADSPRLTLAPVRFDEVTVDAGTPVHFEVVVANETERSLRLDAMALSLAGASDPTAYAVPARPAGGDESEWVTFPGFDRSRELAPGRQLRVPVRVDVPDDATPGSHAIGIAFTQRVVAPGASTDEAARVDVDAGPVSVAVIRVAGTARPALRIRDVDMPRVVWGGSSRSIHARLENSGDVQLLLDGRLELDGVAGAGSRTLRAALRDGGAPTLPSGSRTLTFRWDDAPLIGRVTPRLVIEGGDGAELEVTRELHAVYVVPPWWLLLLVAGAIALPLAGRRRRRRP